MAEQEEDETLEAYLEDALTSMRGGQASPSAPEPEEPAEPEPEPEQVPETVRKMLFAGQSSGSEDSFDEDDDDAGGAGGGGGGGGAGTAQPGAWVDQGNVCSFCFDPGDTKNPLQRGCECKGEDGFAHMTCRISHASANYRGWFECKECRRDHTGDVRLGLATAHWASVRDKPPDHWKRMLAAKFLAKAREVTVGDIELEETQRKEALRVKAIEGLYGDVMTQMAVMKAAKKMKGKGGGRSVNGNLVKKTSTPSLEASMRSLRRLEREDPSLLNTIINKNAEQSNDAEERQQQEPEQEQEQGEDKEKEKGEDDGTERSEDQPKLSAKELKAKTKQNWADLRVGARLVT